MTVRPHALTTATLAALTSVGAAVSAAPVADAATSGATYQHGSYAQGHWSTRAACDSARSAAIKAISSHGGTSVKTGECHEISAGAGTTRQSGYLYDMTYRRSNALWYGDTRLGAGAVTPLVGAHSFKAPGTYTSQTAAKKAESERITRLGAADFGAKVTWRSGVKFNAVTKTWDYEIDYTSRIPLTPRHIEISQKAGVTSPSLGVVNPIPTNPTTDAATPDTTVVTPPPVITPAEPTSVAGIDISGHTVLDDWAGWKSAGVQFAYVKASEGTYYTNPKFSSQYLGANTAGVLRGAYHFANPSVSTGAEQADYFVNHGGGWSADGKTLPGALDMEWNPYGAMCFGMSTGQMRTWVNDFVTQYKARTGVAPMIYTASIWWNKCVGSDATNTGAPTSSTTTPAATVTDAMLAANPLWIAQYNTTLGALPTTWSLTRKQHAIWQNAALDSKGYDTNIFNGTLTQLKAYATTGRR